MRLWTCLLLLSAAQAALGPRYARDVLCPPDACLRRNPRLPTHWSGPESMYFECAHRNGPVSAPRLWGTELEPALEAAWRAEGWHAEHCATPPWANLLHPYISSSGGMGAV